jgi:hypothetical protein
VTGEILLSNVVPALASAAVEDRDLLAFGDAADSTTEATGGWPSYAMELWASHHQRSWTRSAVATIQFRPGQLKTSLRVAALVLLTRNW